MRIGWLILLAAMLGGFLGLGVALATFETVVGLGDPPPKAKKLANDERAPVLPPADGPQPKVVVEHELFDFGAADPETVGRHAFVFRNVGEAPLVLAQGDTTCKCTISKLGTEPIPPGGSAEVTLEWTVKEMPQAMEEFRQEAVIFTNDRTRDRVKLVVQGKISRTLLAFPPTLRFGRLLRTSDETRATQLMCLLAEPFEIKSAVLSNQGLADHFELSYRLLAPEEFAAPDAKTAYEISLRAKPGLPLGELQQTIRLTTNLERNPEFVLAIEGFVDSDFTIFGRGWHRLTQTIDLGRLGPGQSLKRTYNIKITGPQWRETQLQTPEIDISGVTVSLGPRTETEQSAQYTLTIEAPADLPAVTRAGTAASPAGRLTIPTTHTETPLLQLHVKLVKVDS